jgi:sarcosine oxidase
VGRLTYAWVVPATMSDVAVVGAGVVGLSVTHVLRERGVDVVCFDHGEPGQGQSAGSSRIFRHHVGTPELAALAVEARAAWEDWSARAGEPLLLQDGWVRLGGDRVADLALLRNAGIPAIEVDPDEAYAQMPVISRPDAPLLLDPLGGATRTDATIAALVRWTAPSLRRARVLAVARDGDAVLLRTDQGEHGCARCLICAGTGTDRLATGMGIAVAQHRRVHGRLTFRRRRGMGAPMPSWSDRSGAYGESAYGLAPDPETYAVGIAALDAYPEGPPESEAVAPGTDLREPFRRIVAYVTAAFTGLDPEPVGSIVRYTTTLDGRDDDAFALRRDGPVAAFAGGNLFKFAPVLGTRLAAAILDEPVEVWPLPGPSVHAA